MPWQRASIQGVPAPFRYLSMTCQPLEPDGMHGSIEPTPPASAAKNAKLSANLRPAFRWRRVCHLLTRGWQWARAQEPPQERGNCVVFFALRLRPVTAEAAGWPANGRSGGLPSRIAVAAARKIAELSAIIEARAIRGRWRSVLYVTAGAQRIRISAQRATECGESTPLFCQHGGGRGL